MDQYNQLILRIIKNHKPEAESTDRIDLRNLERTYWKQVEQINQKPSGPKLGARITELYLQGLIENKNGYTLTRKGRYLLNDLKSAVFKN